MQVAGDEDEVARILGELIELLHQGASSDDFAAQLAQVERLPDNGPGKAALVERVRMAMAVRNRIDLLQQRESGMLAVVESARDLSSSLHLQQLLQAIVSRARGLLGSPIAWLSAYDSELDAFHVLASDGALAKSTGEMVAARDHGIVSVVVATRLPFSTPDYLHDHRFAHDARLDATFRDEGVAAVVGVPLLWEEEVIGLLFVADRYQRTHTALSISILSALATHAAVAIKNAMAFENASAAVRSAELAREELERHIRGVQASVDSHEQLTSLLARGASLATICQSVSDMMRANVLVLDEAAQVIGRAAPEGAGPSGADAFTAHGEHSADLAGGLRRSRQVGRSVVAYESDGEACRINAVIAGDELLGSVLMFRREPMDEISVRTFERCTTIIGVVLLSRERMEASKSRFVSELLRGLISSRQDDLASLCERAARCGLDLDRACTLTLIDAGDPGANYLTRRIRSANLLPEVVFDDIDGVLTVLCATTRLADVRRVLAEVARQDLGANYRGVFSRPMTAPAEIPGLYLSLRRALPVLGRIGVRGNIVGQNEMALYSTLFETHDQASLADFLESTIGPLLAHDRRRGSELAATLLSYFDNNQNATSVAQRLAIHVNTVRQRLSTIEDMLGHWGNATRALELHMALRLWHLNGGGPDDADGLARARA